MARLTFLGNAQNRLTFDGVAAFYQALQRGADGARNSPIYYVSSSPWNLYDLLTDFMELQGIPAGPLCLRDLGFDEDKFITTGHGSHKKKYIERILQSAPHLPFILVGDSGQHDPEVYAELAEAHPDRICAVYIRDVADAERAQAVNRISEHVCACGVPMTLVPDTLLAAEHAKDHGLISAEQLAQITLACDNPTV